MSPANGDGALYTFEGGRYLPGPLTVGPWSDDAQHGGPVAALLARACESAGASAGASAGETASGSAGTFKVDPAGMQVVRLTVELLRPAPLTPLLVRSDVVRPGRNVQLAEASLWSDDTEVARARGLRIRRRTMDLPVDRTGPPVDPPADPEARKPPDVVRTAFAEAVDLRFVHGSWDDTGPVTMWTRLVVPVVEGEDPTPLQRTAAAADFGNGVSRLLDFNTHTFINPDLTVALSRVPEGEWILFDVVSRLSADGFGQAESQIFDRVGPAGRSVQSLLVSER
jgi:acyl-coenzyme A thioesterase PaaI-like protein